MHSLRQLCVFSIECLVLSKKLIASFCETIPTESIQYLCLSIFACPFLVYFSYSFLFIPYLFYFFLHEKLISKKPLSCRLFSSFHSCNVLPSERTDSAILDLQRRSRSRRLYIRILWVVCFYCSMVEWKSRSHGSSSTVQTIVAWERRGLIAGPISSL